MSLPADYPAKTAFYYVSEDETFVHKFMFREWLGPRQLYAVTTAGHELKNERCYPTREEAVAVAVRKLRALIKRIQKGGGE